jgi:hypothetical protein
MRKVLLGCCLTAMVAVPVIAQGGSTPQAPPTDPFATYLKGAFKLNANYLVKSAQEISRRQIHGQARYSARDAHICRIDRPCH